MQYKQGVGLFIRTFINKMKLEFHQNTQYMGHNLIPCGWKICPHNNAHKKQLMVFGQLIS